MDQIEETLEIESKYYIPLPIITTIMNLNTTQKIVHQYLPDSHSSSIKLCCCSGRRGAAIEGGAEGGCS